MAKDLELMLEELYYKTDNVLGTKLLDKIISEAYQNKLLDEAGGILTRAVGSVYSDTNGVQYQLIVAKTLPQNGGSYENNDKLEADLLKMQKKYGIAQIDHQVGDAESGKAAIYVFFKEVNGSKTLALVKYSKSVQTTTVWADNQLTALAGISQVKKSGAASASQVNKIMVKPDDLVGDENDRSVPDLEKFVLAKALVLQGKKIPEFPQESYGHIKSLFSASLNSQDISPTLSGSAAYAQAYSLYLGEIFAPVAVVQNWNCDGAREVARKAILGGKKDFSEATIKFSIGKAQPLFDSTLVHPSGKEIFISSKADKGAPASITSLLTNIDDLLNTDGLSKKMKEKNKALYDQFIANFGKFYNLVKTVDKETAWTGPIVLAKQYGLLTETEEECFTKMGAYQGLNSAAFNKIATTSQKEMVTKSKQKKLFVPPSMQKFLNAYTPKDTDMTNYKPALHYMCGLATLVVIKLNEDEEMNFDGAARACLNSCLIQVNTKVKKIGKDSQFQKFTVTYPPKFNGKILADSTKNYSATRFRGKICFKIPVT